MTLKAQMSVVTLATFLLPRSRKPMVSWARCDVPVEIAEVSAAEAPIAGRVLRGRSYPGAAQSETEYRQFGGRILNKVCESPTDDAPVSPAYLAAALGPAPAAGRDVTDYWLPLDNGLFTVLGRPMWRRQVPTLEDIEKEIGPFKQIVDDGSEKAGRIARAAAPKIVLIDGEAHLRAPAPRWEVSPGVSDKLCRVIASTDTANLHRLFHYTRREDALRMADMIVARRRHLKRGGDEGEIEIADPALVPERDATDMVFSPDYADVWRTHANVLAQLPISGLVEWGRLRDMQQQGGDEAQARAVMSAAIRFNEALKEGVEAGRFGDDAVAHLNATVLHLMRTRDFELPRLGGPSVETTNKAEDDAISDIAPGIV